MHIQSTLLGDADKTKISRLWVSPWMPWAALAALVVPWTMLCHSAVLGRSSDQRIDPRSAPEVLMPHILWLLDDRRADTLRNPNK